MGIRIKILLTIVSVFVLLLGIAALSLDVLLHDSLENQEQREIGYHVQRLDAELAQQLVMLDAAAQDWATWDDTYRYIRQPEARFEQNNLSVKALEVVRFHMLALVDLQGRPRVLVEVLGGVARPSRALPPELQALIRVVSRSSTGGCGLVDRQPYPMLYCLRPVVPSQMQHPANGYLLAGRYLTPELLEGVRRAIRLPLSLRRELAPGTASLSMESDEAGQLVLPFKELNRRQYELFRPLLDYGQRPVAWLRFVYERTLAEQSNALFFRVLVWVTAALWAVVLLLYFLLERVLVRRLFQLEEVVVKASQQQDWAGPVPHTRDRDEIGLLASGIDKLFQEMARNVSQLKAESLQDGLTGLPNRRHFDQKLQFYALLCQRQGQSLSVMMIDVDHFKGYNDHYGHQAGDVVLQQVAQTLSATLYRATDFVARYGGEEFAVILPNTDRSAAQEIAERLRAAVESRRWGHEAAPRGYLTISIGAACSEALHVEFDVLELLRHADEALYEAKASGRNRCVLHPPQRLEE